MNPFHFIMGICFAALIRNTQSITHSVKEDLSWYFSEASYGRYGLSVNSFATE